MPDTRSGSGLYLTAALLCAAAFAGCASDPAEPGTVPSQPTTSNTSGTPAVSSAGQSASAAAGIGNTQTPRAGTPAAANGGTSAPSAGTRAPGPGTAGAQAPGGDVPAPITAGRGGSQGNAGMQAAAGTAAAGSGSTCNAATAGCGSEPGAGDPTVCQVGPIPADVRAEYKLDAFYTRYASADGTPIVATDKPIDESIRRACLVVLDLSSTTPMARQSMRTNHVYFIMMAKTEKTVETPEYRSRGDLDARARGFGNNPGLCAEENVMCDRTTDRWRGESICVHEYSHVMHLYVWNRVISGFDSKVTAAYNNAVRSMGKYPNTYAASNAVEYFAEGVQDWYNTNLQSSRGESGDGVHNHINTRAELKAYDPMLYDLLATVLPDIPQYKDCYYYE